MAYPTPPPTTSFNHDIVDGWGPEPGGSKDYLAARLGRAHLGGMHFRSVWGPRRTHALVLAGALLVSVAACAPPAPPACPDPPGQPAAPSEHDRHAVGADGTHGHDKHAHDAPAHDEHGHGKPAAEDHDPSSGPSGESFAIAAAASDQAIHPAVLHEDRDVKIVVVTIKPGGTMAEHATPVPVTVQTISGHGTMSVAGKANVLQAGTVFRLDASAPHALVAEGEEPLVVLVHYIKGGKAIGHHAH
jgi:quercetin dioxygenase-like cupin family protein